MFQTCQNCSYESPASARFCRQCGAELFIETESSGASTRNYGRQGAAPTAVKSDSGYLPPSVADAVAGDTERYYQAQYIPAPITPPTTPIKSGFKLWRWMIAFLFVLLIGASIGVFFSRGSRREVRMPPEEAARIRREDEARRRQEQLRRDAENQMRDAENRARDLRNRARDALKQSSEAAERASEAGAAIAQTDEKPLDLSQYEYPGATAGNTIRIPGREMLTMRVSDGHFDAVYQFYQKKFGKPIIEFNEPAEDRLLIFHSNTSPAISVSIETDDEHPGPMLKIVVLRSPFPIFRPIETQKPK
ncbi:MAG: hypothetical protein AB7U82_26080 [Blastocatellales bacterium]